MKRDTVLKSAGALAVIVLVAACSGESPDGRTGSIGIGTIGGAAAGAIAGRGLGGGPIATATGALVGGAAGNMLVDRPEDKARAREAEAAKDRDVQRQLDYERQSAIQEERVQNEIQEQRLYDQWKAENSAGAVGVSNGDIVTAQRLLTAHGLYSGPIDGDAGPGTTNAVLRFQEQQGLAQTGNITQTLISQLRASL